jgi:hypothetical protein
MTGRWNGKGHITALRRPELPGHKYASQRRLPAGRVDESRQKALAGDTHPASPPAMATNARSAAMRG